MRLSISAKIFVGFLVVLGVFFGVSVYIFYSQRQIGEEVRLVSRGYLDLRLGTSEMQTGQSKLLQVMDEQQARPDALKHVPRIVKSAIDFERRNRLKTQIPRAIADVGRLEALRSSKEEHALLNQLRGRLERLMADVRADEELFDEVYGPLGDEAPPRKDSDLAHLAASSERLMQKEQAIQHSLSRLSTELTLRAQQSGLRLEEEENRASWVLLLLVVLALAVGVLVSVWATRRLRPLRRLAERAKQIARGDYKQRVDASSPDEIGALGREFNAMAGALDEREQQLIRSERLAAVGKIAAQITHEVRNPLSSIGLNAELLEEEVAALGGPQAQEAQAIARAIVKEVDRLTEITEEYLRFARLPRPKLEREDVRAIVSSLVVFLKSELDGRRIEVALELPPLPPVAADEHQLRQALLNLMRNAAEAMPSGGRLTVAARALINDRAVELRIADTGQGIAREHLAKIFDPFFSTKDGGTGLGLALTQQIVVEHGGSIAVESEPGRGTAFTVRLPALAANESADAPPAREPGDLARGTTGE
ncbi:MAG TPA: ATP-binding protein [Polyangia bacterium]|nr:ATP-binding protein [Polyangia bacterium]